MFEKIGMLACLMADAYEAQRNGNTEAAQLAMSVIQDEGQQLNSKHFELLLEAVENAIGWVGYCQRHKAS